MAQRSNMISKRFLQNYQGEDVFVYTLTATNISVDISTLGASIQKVVVPDKNGNPVDVVLGTTECADLSKMGYLGAVVGRCANRIANGKFTLEGTTYQLGLNKGNLHIHGGANGFAKRVYNSRVEGNTLVLFRTSLDGEEGYPGKLDYTVQYTAENGSLKIVYTGVCNKTTLFNPTNHVYFNLEGEGNGTILQHVAQINADHYLKNNEIALPVAKVAVDGTAFDFRTPKQIGQDILAEHPDLANSRGGYDHNFCLETEHFATIYAPHSGIQLDAFTNQKGVQFYTANGLNTTGKHVYGKFEGFCLETQTYPDAINHPDYPTSVLKAGQQFFSTTTFVFSTRK